MFIPASIPWNKGINLQLFIKTSFSKEVSVPNTQTISGLNCLWYDLQSRIIDRAFSETSTQHKIPTCNLSPFLAAK